MIHKESHPLEFEFIPDQIKEYAYSKYAVDSLSVRTFGEIDKDYFLVLVAYKDSDNLIDLFGSYKAFDDSLQKHIFDKSDQIVDGAFLLKEAWDVYVEKLDQSEVLALLENE